jgi:prolyl oligopeptidase
MFLVYRKGLKLDGTNPTLLYAYGGFNITTSPCFSSLRLALLEQGFVYASANIRGGGEYGEKWHEAGTKLKKQNVFDDFIAAAEWLIANKYTSRNTLRFRWFKRRIAGGRVINQRPELFRPAIPQVGSWTCSDSTSSPSVGIGSRTMARATMQTSSRLAGIFTVAQHQARSEVSCNLDYDS